MSELALLTLVGLAIVSLWMILVGAIQWRTARPIQKRAGFGRGPAEVRWLGLAEVLGGIALCCSCRGSWTFSRRLMLPRR